MDLSDNAKKLLTVVKEHPLFEKAKEGLVAEMSKMDELEVTNDLFTTYNKLKDGKIKTGDTNVINSAMAYMLGVTTAKPKSKFDLEKRRTYGRAGFPDIDMDFDYSRRHEIVEYITEKYGKDYVGNIGTVQTLKTRNAVRRAIKTLDPEEGIVYNQEGKVVDQSANYAFQNEVLGSLPESHKPLKKSNGDPVNNVTEACKAFPAFGAYMKRYPEVLRVAKKMEGSISAFGCLAKDTGVKTDKGQVRIDEIDSTVKVAYVNYEGEIKYTSNFYAHKTGEKKCYKLKLASGDWIKVTDEHFLFTDKGCVEFEKIRKNPEKYKVYIMSHLG